ncbi:N-acetylmuramidase family protein [Paraburkholderia hiiakae]|uniref:N-acetylmuramidase family protein n=1 Tax=Paraburkholderia hiiakae TaxID=1081782 RepID=UPI001F1FD2C8|nr:N-acetylmuramidase family protein [Paraburkholderia hiiakae]
MFRDTLQKPIEGLSVLVKAGKGAPQAPEWKLGQDSADPPAANPASAPDGASAPAPDASAPLVDNRTEVVTDASGYAVTIQNAARNQPVDIGVKNRRGKYAWKATVTPKKDVSAFTIVSPEYHLEATTKLTPKDELEQDLDLPVVREGEIMTIERLVHDFGPFIGWSQKVTEQGQVKKDFPTKKKEVTEDQKTHNKTTQITIEHHYKVVDTGKPRTIVLNVLGSRLNFPNPALFSEDQYKSMATQLDVEVAAIKAIVMQECSGIPFEENGLPKIRYERHLFYRALKLRYEAQEAGADKAAHKKGVKRKGTPFANPYPQYPELCFPEGGGYGSDGLHQYEKLTRAAALDFDLAIQACSWGGFQILASAYASCGCATSFEFANKFMSGSEEQAQIFVLFMRNVKPDATVALRTHDWDGVASGYNGAYWQDTNPDYAKNLGLFYEKFK